MNVVARLREFTAVDFTLSYFAKFCLGLGIGLLLPEAWHRFGWGFIGVAVLVGFRAELKFFRSHK